MKHSVNVSKNIIIHKISAKCVNIFVIQNDTFFKHFVELPALPIVSVYCTHVGSALFASGRTTRHNPCFDNRKINGRRE